MRFFSFWVEITIMKRKYGILVGIAAAVLISGIFSTFTLQQSTVEPPTPEDFKEVITGMEEDVDGSELEIGQVEKEEGAYSP